MNDAELAGLLELKANMEKSLGITFLNLNAFIYELVLMSKELQI